ncbi:uncharacterized protein LOC141617932 [Silene latifolia]|uniref:uncharacterized protein LOC141617932 n=1 Tax=Silene latifolia TaxID=37657 RepID=UPI003D775E38
MPKGFTNPNMPLLDGTTNPFDHISQYKQKMMTVTVVGQVKEACMCKGFGSTLAGPVFRWFVSLPNRSISTFAELVNVFTQQFACSRKPQKHVGDLYRIVQGAGETIGEYNTSFEAVQEKAAATIRLEEDILARPSLLNTPSVSSTSAVEKSGRKQPTSIGGILKALREIGDGVRWPKPPVEEQGWRKDSKKKCEFHRDNWHNTEDCYTLRREIKRLYEQGGSDLSGLTYSTAKRHATETKGDRPARSCRISHSDLPAVTFDEGDTYDEREHHDALIITLSMANCTVRKVLVYTGSSVNLIMLKTIENMGFSEKDLQKKTIPLVGFSGETANSLGEIVIPTYVGGVNKKIRYLVIDGTSTYNVILGRPWLHQMKAVPLTYHQCIKFPTPWGVETIRGDQEESRGSYKKALKCTASPPA